LDGVGTAIAKGNEDAFSFSKQNQEKGGKKSWLRRRSIGLES
jgi:hypothetical protein